MVGAGRRDDRQKSDQFQAKAAQEKPAWSDLCNHRSSSRASRPYSSPSSPASVPGRRFPCHTLRISTTNSLTLYTRK